MKNFLIALIVFSGVGYAQDSNGSPRPPAVKPAEPQPPRATGLVRRLETVSWNPVSAELTWVVSVGDITGGVFQPTAKENYTIHIDSAIMKFNGEGRHFDPDEARRVRMLMDMISTYAVESTVWWDHGEGSKMDGEVIPLPDGKDGNNSKKEKEEKPKPAPKPSPVVLHGPVAAANPSQQRAGAAVESHP
jgi:hypothetical protein